jgi:hypothetical protein
MDSSFKDHSATLKRAAHNDAFIRGEELLRKKKFNSKRGGEKSIQEISDESEWRPSPFERNSKQMDFQKDKSRSSQDNRLSPIYKLDEELDSPEVVEAYPFVPPKVEVETVLMYGEPKYLAKGRGKDEYREFCKTIKKKKCPPPKLPNSNILTYKSQAK